MEQPIKKNKFSYFARARLRLRPQEIWGQDYKECFYGLQSVWTAETHPTGDIELDWIQILLEDFSPNIYRT